MKRSILLAIAALALSAPAAHAITWTEIASGTTSEITAIEYQSPTRFWFTTANGAIFKRQPDGTFAQVRPPGAVRLTDIEFQDGGNVGLAVGDGGLVLRSVDAGATWAPVTGIPVSKKAASSTFPNCTAAESLGNVYSVRFASANRAWIMAEGSQLARTVASATAATVGQTGGWEDANWVDVAPPGRGPEDTCRIPEGYNAGIADAFFVPSNPDVAYFVDGTFANVWFTTDNLASNGVQKPAAAGNTGEGSRVIAGDPDNPQRMWSVNGTPYGASTAQFTEDGYQTAERFRLGNDTKREFPTNGPYDVDFKNGTVLSAGDAGLILSSVDGRTFYYVDDAALPAQDWRAVGLADGSNAAVGGKNGKLIISSDAAVVPDVTPPTATISGPVDGKAGQPLTFTATLVDNAGGSGINPAATKWTTPGLPDQAGNPATFTFPNPGFYTITLTFADNAGNTATLTKSVDVGAASGPSRPAPILPASNNPPLVGGGAKKKGKYIVLKVKGRLGLPPGADKAAACKGTMSISVYKGKKRLVGKKTKVKSTCGYKKTIKVKRKRVGKARKLKLKVAFKGNDVLAPLSSTYKVKVKKR